MASSAALEFDVQGDEVHVQKGDIALCFLINRSMRTMRVIDFRAGYAAQKADIVQEVALREGVERVFTVVEREEATTWNKLGFDKEGTIPGFYKRSDAHVLGMAVDQRGQMESGTRIRVKLPEGTESPDLAERAYQSARKFSRTFGPGELPKVNVAEAREQDVARAFEVAQRNGRDLSRFEPFGRGGVRRAYLCTARGGFSLLVGLEVQSCFDNAWLEMLVAPRGDKEIGLTVSAIQQVSARLAAEGIVSAFALAPADSVEVMAALNLAGFRKTGRLPGHLALRGTRSDAFLWSRKLSDPD